MEEESLRIETKVSSIDGLLKAIKKMDSIKWDDLSIMLEDGSVIRSGGNFKIVLSGTPLFESPEAMSISDIVD